MKTTSKPLVILCFLSASVLAGEYQVVSAEKFRELATLPIGTMGYSKYLGIKGEKACVAVHEMSSFNKKWSKTIRCTEANELDKTFLETLVPVNE